MQQEREQDGDEFVFPRLGRPLKADVSRIVPSIRTTYARTTLLFGGYETKGPRLGSLGHRPCYAFGRSVHGKPEHIIGHMQQLSLHIDVRLGREYATKHMAWGEGDEDKYVWCGILACATVRVTGLRS